MLLLLIGFAAGTAFVRRQLNRPQPMLDVRLFSRSSFSGAVLANLLSVFSLVGFLFFVSQHLQLVLGESPMQAGLILLPGLVVTVVAGLAVVPLVRRVTPRTVVAGGLLISAAGYVAVLLGAHEASAGALALAFVLLSLGIGAAETISNDVIISSVPADKAGAASAISETAYEMGAVLGTAVLGGILTAAYSARVVVPAGLSAADTVTATETLGGATAVAAHLPQPQAGAAARLGAAGLRRWRRRDVGDRRRADGRRSRAGVVHLARQGRRELIDASAGARPFR